MNFIRSKVNKRTVCCESVLSVSWLWACFLEGSRDCDFWAERLKCGGHWWMNYWRISSLLTHVEATEVRDSTMYTSSYKTFCSVRFHYHHRLFGFGSRCDCIQAVNYALSARFPLKETMLAIVIEPIVRKHIRWLVVLHFHASSCRISNLADFVSHYENFSSPLTVGFTPT